METERRGKSLDISGMGSIPPLRVPCSPTRDGASSLARSTCAVSGLGRERHGWQQCAAGKALHPHPRRRRGRVGISLFLPLRQAIDSRASARAVGWGNRSTDLGGETGFLLRCHLPYPSGDPSLFATNWSNFTCKSISEPRCLLMRLALIKLDCLYF